MREELDVLRNEIDDVDARLVPLFEQRMSLVSRIADVKARANIPVLDEKREESVVRRALERSESSVHAEVIAFMRMIMALSRIHQNEKLMPDRNVCLPPPRAPKSGDATVAYQGVPGAWGELAAITIRKSPNAANLEYFDDVFEAVKSGKYDYGVLPIENSQTGAIGQVYDLLRRHGCYIVAQTWVPIQHCLLGFEGVQAHEIRTVYSHSEGFNQCRRFLKNRNWELKDCRNTAVAAEMVAKSGDRLSAAIASRRAAQLNGLSVIAPDIIDNTQNKTRFIAIAAEPEYDEHSDITGVTFSTAHKSGALCAVLQSFMLSGINLCRIESRPASAGTYRFFADLQANILDPATKDALRQAAAHCDYFEVLGCYGTVL